MQEQYNNIPTVVNVLQKAVASSWEGPNQGHYAHTDFLISTPMVLHVIQVGAICTSNASTDGREPIYAFSGYHLRDRRSQLQAHTPVASPTPLNAVYLPPSTIFKVQPLFEPSLPLSVSGHQASAA